MVLLLHRPRKWNSHSKFMHENGQASALPSCLGESTPRMSILDDGLPERAPERRIHCCHANEEDKRGVNVMAAKKGCGGKLDAAAECVCMTIPERIQRQDHWTVHRSIRAGETAVFGALTSSVLVYSVLTH